MRETGLHQFVGVPCSMDEYDSMHEPCDGERVCVLQETVQISILKARARWILLFKDSLWFNFLIERIYEHITADFILVSTIASYIDPEEYMTGSALSKTILNSPVQPVVQNSSHMCWAVQFRSQEDRLVGECLWRVCVLMVPASLSRNFMWNRAIMRLVWKSINDTQEWGYMRVSDGVVEAKSIYYLPVCTVAYPTVALKWTKT